MCVTKKNVCFCTLPVFSIHSKQLPVCTCTDCCILMIHVVVTNHSKLLVNTQL